MPRAATGSLFESPPNSGNFYAQITVGQTPLGKSHRRSFALPTCTDRTSAEARKDLLAGLARKLRDAGRDDLVEELVGRAAPLRGRALDEVVRNVDLIVAGKLAPPHARSAAKAITIRVLGERWTSGELHQLYPDHIKKKRSMGNDAGRLEKYVYPAVGDVPIDVFNLDHAELVMAGVPADRAPATRRHVAQALHRLCKMAVFPLRLIPTNPLPPGFLPKLPPGKAKGWLYPDEDAQLLGATKAIPLEWRLFYGFLHREGPRFTEAARLTWSDIDLERGAIVLDENKTDDPRAWALSPGVPAALRAWRALRVEQGAPVSPNDLVFVNERGKPLSEQHAAERYREHLLAAGVSRSVLFERTKSRQPIRVHDTRATFVTIALANGKSETWVMDRTGHKSSLMINRYRRAARTAAELGLGDLRALDQAIPELATVLSRQSASAAERSQREQPAVMTPTAAEPVGEESPGETPQEFVEVRAADRADVSKSATSLLVAPPGLEPGYPCGPRILKPVGATRIVANRVKEAVLRTDRDGSRELLTIQGRLLTIHHHHTKITNRGPEILGWATGAK